MFGMIEKKEDRNEGKKKDRLIFYFVEYNKKVE